MKAEIGGPDPEHAPAVEQENAEHDGYEHGFGGEGVEALETPEEEDAEGLGGDADEEEVGEGEGVIGDEGVLEGADDGDGGVEGVAEEEVACWEGVVSGVCVGGKVWGSRRGK